MALSVFTLQIFCPNCHFMRGNFEKFEKIRRLEKSRKSTRGQIEGVYFFLVLNIWYCCVTSVNQLCITMEEKLSQVLLKVPPLHSTNFKLSNQYSSLNIVKFTDLIIKCCNTVANAIKNQELHLIPWKSMGYQILPPRKTSYLKIFLHVLG